MFLLSTVKKALLHCLDTIVYNWNEIVTLAIVATAICCKMGRIAETERFIELFLFNLLIQFFWRVCIYRKK